jgi:ectoine hydroxylase-related dioxygenase (phytanoyl-CoA dioxygenase family)
MSRDSSTQGFRGSPDFQLLGAHALNRHFAWEPREGPFRIVSQEQATCYDDNGFFLLQDAFDAATMKAVIAAIDPHEERVEAFLRSQKDGKLFIARANEISFTTHLVARSAFLRAFCSSRVFQHLAFDLLGDDVRLYWDQAVYKKPGTADHFPWHQDNGYTFLEPQQYLTCWVALTDATPANGCPWVLPGAHRMGTLAHRATDLGFACLDDPAGATRSTMPSAAVAISARAGDIVVFSSLTPHATGANQTTQVRKSYIVQFAPDGAHVIRDGERTPCDAPERQFPILLRGAPPG